MLFVPLDINSTERTRRAQVLAGSAAYATLDIDRRNLRCIGIVAVIRYHGYRSCRTVAGAISAIDSLRNGQAVAFNPNGMTDLYRRLLGTRDLAYGSRWTHLRTLGTLRTAISAFV